jgi:cobyrinic acid a,c-diamide synthase
MCGVVPGSCHAAGKLVRFGYVELRERRPVFLREGGAIRGHEFHYFDSDNNGGDCRACKPVSGRGWDCIHEASNHWWGFAHLYYLSAPEYVTHFVEECKKYQKGVAASILLHG